MEMNDSNVQERVGMGALELLHTRQSAKRLQEPAPTDTALDAIFAAAVRAPDHGQLRPWRFIVIRGDARLRFGDVMAESRRLEAPDSTPDALKREREKALRAPVIVVVAARVQPEARIPEIEQILSAGAAAQNIMLAAHALGYGAMWKTGEPAYDPYVKEALGLKASDAIVGFIYLGTRAGAPPPTARPGADQFIQVWE
jgi:nitroreductase